MDEPPKLGSTVLVGAIAVVTAAAWMASEAISNTPPVPPSALEKRVAPAPNEPIPVKETVAAHEAPETRDEARLTAENPAPPRVSAPVVTKARKAQPARATITVEERRLTQDQRIQAQVMRRLASAKHVSGKIAVEARASVVRLSGWTRTAGQAQRAERIARGVRGVKHVRNEIRPRMGG